jgi:DNA-directed RNA polymerase subunit RPC12/RpoP
MLQTVACPKCGDPLRIPPSMLGQEVQCAACLHRFAARAAAAPLPPAGGPTPPPNRTVLAEPEAMIHYSCPRCKKPLESPVSFAGQKLNCPGCGQRLQIPQPAAPQAPALNKTMLATQASGPGSSGTGLQPAAGALVPTVDVEVVNDAPKATPVRRDCCLECGVDVSQRPRVQTCPDCGTLLCSSMCYRAHRYYAHPPKKAKPRRRIVECDYCGSSARPYYVSKISEAGWITFVILLIFFFPLCWIGLLITETDVRCHDCGARLG